MRPFNTLHVLNLLNLSQVIGISQLIMLGGGQNPHIDHHSNFRDCLRKSHEQYQNYACL